MSSTQMNGAMRRMLAFGTYPIRKPLHGGQRRCLALGQAHRARGHQYLYCSAVLAGPYSNDDLTNYDYVVQEPDLLAGGWAGDVHVGRHSADRDDAFEHFQRICEVFDPDVFVLEQPFMWPVVERLKSQPRYRNIPVVYSSHNVEALLKASVLAAAGIDRQRAAMIVAMVDELERKIVASAASIFAVSAEDGQVYRSWRSDVKVDVVPNGINPTESKSSVRDPSLPNPYVLFVGSGHLPNRDGFLDLVVGDGVQFLPPEKHIVVAGGVSDLIYHHPVFQGRLISNCDRMQFFARPTDSELSALIEHATAILLPIQDGGGTNLKTAEAILSGKRIIGTPTAFRGFEKYKTAKGVTIARTRSEFVDGIRDALGAGPLELPKSELTGRLEVTWSHVLKNVDFAQSLAG